MVPCAQLQLHGAVVQIQKRNSRIAGQANRSRADVNFAARILVGPQIVASGERAIDVRLQPILFASRLKRNRALHVVQARDACGRINYLRLGLRRVLARILILVLRSGAFAATPETGTQ